MKKDRNSNFELMRIISMLMIICHHIIVHGNLLNNCQRPGISSIIIFLNILFKIHILSFIVITGYFQSKSQFKLSKMLNLIIEGIFYSTIIFFIGYKLGWVDSITPLSIIQNIGIDCFSTYWFIATYLIVYMLSNYINKFINRLTHIEFKRLIMLLFFILCIIPFASGGNFIKLW